MPASSIFARACAYSPRARVLAFCTSTRRPITAPSAFGALRHKIYANLLEPIRKVGIQVE